MENRLWIVLSFTKRHIFDLVRESDQGFLWPDCLVSLFQDFFIQLSLRPWSIWTAEGLERWTLVPSGGWLQYVPTQQLFTKSVKVGKEPPDSTKQLHMVPVDVSASALEPVQESPV